MKLQIYPQIHIIETFIGFRFILLKFIFPLKLSASSVYISLHKLAVFSSSPKVFSFQFWHIFPSNFFFLLLLFLPLHWKSWGSEIKQNKATFEVCMLDVQLDLLIILHITLIDDLIHISSSSKLQGLFRVALKESKLFSVHTLNTKFLLYVSD